MLDLSILVTKLTWRLVSGVQGPLSPVEVMTEAVLLVLAPTKHRGCVGDPQRELDAGIVMGSLNYKELFQAQSRGRL